MNKKRIAPDDYPYTANNSFCTAKGPCLWNKALGILRLMDERGGPPNVYAYSGAINALGRAKHREKALGLLREINDCRIGPNDID